MTTAEPAQRACPDWLDLREAADAEARDDGAAGLLEVLVAHLRRRSGGRAPVRVVDVGAGTGANRRYLTSRLPSGQVWVSVDHDRELLEHPGHDGADRVHGALQDLPPEFLGPDDPSEVPTVVVANAVLDVLTTEDLAALADGVVSAGGAALFSLSVTGRVWWEPPDPSDHLLSSAFDEHQRRGGRPGPEAPEVLAGLLRARGLEVSTAPTPWDLPGPAGRHEELLRRWLAERVDDAVDHDPASAEVLRAWHARRRAQLASGALRVLVDHVDLLALDVVGPHGAQGGA